MGEPEIIPTTMQEVGGNQDWDRPGRPGRRSQKQTRSRSYLSSPEYIICPNTLPPILTTVVRAEDTNSEVK